MDLKVVDNKWEKEQSINCYALFMGYLSMAIRGMGYLVLTWSTVVLLGGFVSVLENKDFWCLTIITLVQTAGVFDVSLKEKLRYIGKSHYGLESAIYAMLIWKNTYGDGENNENYYWGPSVTRRVAAFIVWLVHLLVAVVILLPLAALYLCGLVFTTGISLWRLIQHDYGKRGDDDANLQPALNVLYSLALFQGSLFCYRVFSSFARKGLVSEVAKKYKMNDCARKSVKNYLRETMIGCEKDPSFVKGRNLVTYAVGMMKSESSKNFLSGARILDALILEQPLEEQHAVIAELIGSASSSHVLEKLLEALDSRSPHDEKMRGFAANIVAHLARKIRLKRFPRGIHCISSLLEISQRQAEDDECAPSADYDYKKLIEKGLVILDGLADDEHNCRVLNGDKGLLSKVVAPVSSDLLHLIDHDDWSIVVAASLQVMCRLVAAPGETGAELRSKISGNKEAINSMEEILKCDKCDEKLQVLTIKILTQLPIDMDVYPTTVNTQSRGNLVKMLPGIFTCETKDSSIRKLAGEALVMLTLNESNAAIILKANDNVVHDLTKILLDAAADSTHRLSAAETMEHLYIHYKENDEHLKKLKEAMECMMPKVLPEILPCELKRKRTQTEKRTEKDGCTPLLDNQDDVEAQDGGASQDDGRDNNTSAYPQNDEKRVARKLHAALLSLATAVFDEMPSQNHGLDQLINTISPGDSATSFATKLKVMVETNSEPTASCLRIMKNTSRMVVSMMKHNGSYLKEDLETFRGLINTLLTACKKMSCLEGSMIFYTANRSAVKPDRTLAFLVNEARKLLEEKEPKQLGVGAIIVHRDYMH